jgi:hypothetical protein
MAATEANMTLSTYIGETETPSIALKDIGGPSM